MVFPLRTLARRMATDLLTWVREITVIRTGHQTTDSMDSEQVVPTRYRDARHLTLLFVSFQRSAIMDQTTRKVSTITQSRAGRRTSENIRARNITRACHPIAVVIRT